MGKGALKPLSELLVHPVVLVLISALILVAYVWISSSPEVRGPNADEASFSAGRAAIVLEEVLEPQVPHVVGSAENSLVRDRIVSVLERFAYQPEVQSRFHCNVDFASCASIQNIIATKPGADHRKAILLTAHYDSGWAGPGAGDDGAGVAVVLEIARMAAEYGEMYNDLIFLFSDGEEQGLIGADAFARHHPLFKSVELVINLDARGVTGPSVLYETGEGNRSVIRIFSKNLPRPVGTSLVNEVYKRMPNFSDYTAYRKHGVMGVNFAFAGGVALYHSALDDIDHLDLRSLQHHGDNAWGMIRALVDRDIKTLTSREDAAYIDIFGRVLWHYPQSIASGVTLLLSVIVLLAISLRFSRSISFAGMLWAVFGTVSIIAILLAGAWLLSWPLGHWIDSHPIEHPEPWMGRLALLGLCLLALWMGCKFFAHRVSYGEATLTCWAVFVVFAFWLGFNLPTASFVALFPLCAYLIGLALDLMFRRTRQKFAFAAIFGLATASYIAVYFFIQLDAVLPFRRSELKAAPLVLLILPMLPGWFGRVEEPVSGWKPGVLLLGFILATCGLHLLQPGYTEDRPRGMNLLYNEISGESQAQVIVATGAGKADKGFLERHEFELQQVPAPWSSPSVLPFGEPRLLERYAVKVPAEQLAGTEIESLGSATAEKGGVWHQLHLSPPEGAEQIVVAFPDPSPVIEARINHVPALDSTVGPDKGPRPRLIRVTYAAADSINLEIRTETDNPPAVAVTTRLEMPHDLKARFTAGWPADAQPFVFGNRAQVVTEYGTGSE